MARVSFKHGMCFRHVFDVISKLRNQPIPSDYEIRMGVNNLEQTGSMNKKKRGGSVGIVRTPENIERVFDRR